MSTALRTRTGLYRLRALHQTFNSHSMIAAATVGPKSQRSMAAKVSPLSSPLPTGTWDSHMHVVEPERFPLSANAKYKPHAHTLDDARAFYSQLNIQNLVLVQPSIYGTDNSCMLEALRALTPAHGRAVVELDPSTIDQSTLEEWHAIGVRGVRVNLVSVGRDLDEKELKTELARYADVIRARDWVLQLYVPLKLVTALEKIAPVLDVRLCIDHFGSPSLPSPAQETPVTEDSSSSTSPSTSVDPSTTTLEGFDALVRLLKTGRTWVKLSAPYRISKHPHLHDLDAIGRTLVREAPDQVVYATDWPHTRFENIDSSPFIEMCYRWCDDVGGDGVKPGEVREKLFRRNAEVLWDV